MHKLGARCSDPTTENIACSYHNNAAMHCACTYSLDRNGRDFSQLLHFLKFLSYQINLVDYDFSAVDQINHISGHEQMKSPEYQANY